MGGRNDYKIKKTLQAPSVTTYYHHHHLHHLHHYHHFRLSIPTTQLLLILPPPLLLPLLLPPLHLCRSHPLHAFISVLSLSSFFGFNYISLSSSSSHSATASTSSNIHLTHSSLVLVFLPRRGFFILKRISVFIRVFTA